MLSLPRCSWCLEGFAREGSSLGAKQVLAEALWCWLTDHAWTVWRCHLRIIHFINVIDANYQDGAHPGLTFHPTCVAAEAGVALSIPTVPAHLRLWVQERAQHNPESSDSSLSCSTCEVGKGDGVNTQGTKQPPLG